MDGIGGVILLTDSKWKVKYDSDENDLIGEFYQPALSAAVRYDRTTGYYSAQILSLVMRGVEKFVENNGRMRLITGCILRPEDLSAIDKGYALREVVSDAILSNPLSASDDSESDALELLSWLISKRRLDVKLAVTCDPLTRKPVAGVGIFHAKTGVLEDGEGNRVAFSGSINETAAGWRFEDIRDKTAGNWEDFHVFSSWTGGAEHVNAEDGSFQKIWADQAKRCLVVDVPEAVKKDLLRFMPRDGELPKLLHDQQNIREEKTDTSTDTGRTQSGYSIDELKRLVWGFIKHGPGLPDGGEKIGEATSTVIPWPHQLKAFHRMYDSWPSRLLIADEVGLGKTIEAGMLVRQAWLSGRAKRILIMAPKGILSQWQIELREKFALNWPIYDGQKLKWFPSRANAGELERQVEPSEWHKEPFVLTSSQLMRRRDRATELIDHAEEYDLIILDEAHHARRRSSSGDGDGTPNELLRLMDRLKDKTESLLLLTATPMQISPVEVWDLLRLLGLPTEWTSSEFSRFYDETTTLNPADESLEHSAYLFRTLEREFAETSIEQTRAFVPNRSRVAAKRVLDALKGRTPIPRRMLSQTDRSAAVKLMRSRSPIGRLISRNTRELLRKYRDEGKLNSSIAERKVEDRFISMSSAEREVYEAIENYVATTFNRASPGNRNAVGFIMTVYRKRVASSFYALSETLKRRLARLTGNEISVDEDDIQTDDLADEVLDLEEAEELEIKALQLEERTEIEALLKVTESLPNDTKSSELADLVSGLRANGHDRVMVFTQFSDTMDYLRDYLHSSDVLCYSGRGGEYKGVDGAWRVVSREEVKRMFRVGLGKVLLCTDAASEGLNFQFCGALINYDMPWNPMAVEQRIGRIDRLGQQHKEIEIFNLHYADTVEADVYKALRERIELFSKFIGKLQPILARLPGQIQKVALGGSARSDSGRADVLDELSIEIDQAENDGFDLDDIVSSEIDIATPNKPIYGLSDLDKILKRPELLPNTVTLSAMGGREYAYSLPGLEEPLRITTDPDYYDQHPESVELWVPGSPTFPEPDSFATKIEIEELEASISDLLK